MENTKTLKDNYELLKSTVESMNNDFTKFNDKKVKVAGARFRNNLLNCKKLCDVLRKQVVEDIRKLPVKHRIETPEPETKEPEPEPEVKEPEPEPKEEEPEMKEETKKPKKKRTRKANVPKAVVKKD